MKENAHTHTKTILNKGKYEQKYIKTTNCAYMLIHITLSECETSRVFNNSSTTTDVIDIV